MGDLLFNVVAFLVALGALIAIHEYGHFWVARKAGVKVLRFSIGFGKPLYRRRGKIDDTEFVLAAIPLGGYVKMLDEREGPVAPQERHRAFNTQSVWARIAIVAAGPLANFLLAIVAYWVMFMIGISGVVPLVGSVDPGSSAARAGFQVEDTIMAVEGRDTRTWNEVRLTLLDESLNAGGLLDVRVQDRDGNSRVRQVELDASAVLNGGADVISELGIRHWWPDVDAVIGGIHAGGAAEAAGLLVGDEVIRVNDTPIEYWRDWVKVVREHPGKTLDVDILREGQEQTLALTPGTRQQGTQPIGYIGAWETQSAGLFERVRTVVQYNPIDAMGIAVTRTWDMTVLTVQMLGKLVVGEASLENISGPITIAQFAGQSASVGLDHYLGFLALISISLAVLNLLPVPILDGGHLLYFFIEAIKGSPLSEKTQLFGQQIGMVLLAGLMSIAFYNDILRLVG
ncbi:MAG TPA: RIP metalloprotease RseP [Gammaproteobacteria bacterium]|nr:RIP metalloprotease RseP [Gammaproteobacteria bacterium]